MHPAGERFELYELDDDASLAALNDGRGPTEVEWADWLGQLQGRLIGAASEQWLAWTEHPGRRSIREHYVRRYFQRPEHTVAAHHGATRELWPLPHHDDDALDGLDLDEAEWANYLLQLDRALAAGRRSADWLDHPRRRRLQARYLETLEHPNSGSRADTAGDADAAAADADDKRPAPGRLGAGLVGRRQPSLSTSPRALRSGARSVTGFGRGLRRVINSSEPVEARKPPPATFNEAHRIQYVAAARESSRRWF